MHKVHTNTQRFLWTLLHRAADSSQSMLQEYPTLEAATLLLAKGADPNLATQVILRHTFLSILRAIFLFRVQLLDLLSCFVHQILFNFVTGS